MNEFSIAREMPSVYTELLENRIIVERLKKLDKKFKDTDWRTLSELQPVEYSYALRFHSMIQEVLRGSNT